MARTRLRQVEQIGNSLAYDDTLNMGSAADGQAGDTITTGTAAAFVIASGNGLTNNVYSIIVRGNFAGYGINSNDQIIVTNSASNNGAYTIISATYASANSQYQFDHTQVIVLEQLIEDLNASASISFKVDPNKNLRRDLDFIRTQLRKLNRTTNWYDEPLVDSVSNAPLQYQSVTGQAIAAGDSIDLTQTFKAGTPYLMCTYVNGQLLVPSVVDSDHQVIVQNDYTEYQTDGNTPATTGEYGRYVKINFNILASDIIQFKWVQL